MKDDNCIDSLFQEQTIFNTLSEAETEIIRSHISCKHYSKGDYVFKEGDMPSGLLYLCKGKAKIFKEGVGGRDQIIRLSKPYGFIGYRALFAEEPYNATASALEDSTICVIDKNAILEAVKLNPKFAVQIMKSMASELGLSNTRTVTLTQKHIRGRLAESLLFLIDTYGFENDHFTINVYLSREDIGNLSNMTTSNAIRTLSSFANEGVLKLSGRKIMVTDLEQLKRISELG